MGTKIPYTSEERDNRGASEFPRILLKHIPGTQESEHPHSCTSFSYVHYKLSAEYHVKRRLRVQNRPAGCILSCTDSAKQQEVPQVCLQKRGVSVSGTSLWSEHSPSDFYSLGAHCDRLPQPSGHFGYSLSGRLAGSTPSP